MWAVINCRCCAGGTESSLLWRHNGHIGVLNHQPHDCFLNRLFRHSQSSIWWRHLTTFQIQADSINPIWYADHRTGNDMNRCYLVGTYTTGQKFNDFFSVRCKTKSRWKFLKLEIKPNYFSLNMWNIIYLGQAVTVQCPQTISNPSNFRCRSRQNVKMNNIDNVLNQ